MKEHNFLEFAQLLDDLEATTKRNDKKTLISSFLKRLGEKEVCSTINFLLGRAFPETDPRILEIGGRTIFRIVKDIKQKTLAPNELIILKVNEYFNEISKAKGKGSRKKKEDFSRLFYCSMDISFFMIPTCFDGIAYPAAVVLDTLSINLG